MREKMTSRFLISFALLAGIFGLNSDLAFAQGSPDGLPLLFDNIPSRLYKILGPVGVDQKTVSEARGELRKQAARLDADAVIAVQCQAGGFSRQGLTWEKRQAYCRGIAVQFMDKSDDKIKPTPKASP